MLVREVGGSGASRLNLWNCSFLSDWICPASLLFLYCDQAYSKQQSIVQACLKLDLLQTEENERDRNWLDRPCQFIFC